MTNTQFKQHSENHYHTSEISCYERRWKSALDIFKQAVFVAPQQTAVASGNEHISYGGLDRLSARFASALLAKGLKAGDRLAINTSNRLEFIVAIVACLKTEIISVPIGSHRKCAELKALYSDAEVSAILFDAETADEQPNLEDIKSLKFMISVDVKHKEAIDFNRFILSPAKELPLTSEDEDQCMTLLYTSSSSENPKGAMLTNLGIVHSIMHLIERLSLQPHETTIAAAPLSHVNGLIAQVHLMFVSMGKLVLMKNFDADEFVNLAEREGLTYSVLPPSMYDQLLEQNRLNGRNLDKWRIAYHSDTMGAGSVQRNTSHKLPKDWAQTYSKGWTKNWNKDWAINFSKKFTDAVPHVTLLNGYSAPEATSVAAMVSYGSDNLGNCIGKAVPCGEIKIVNNEGEPAKAKELGELWIKGPMVVPGYWKDTNTTKSNFEDGYWKTGDTGYCDEDGNFYIETRH